MNRDVAIIALKEIFDRLPELDATAITIMSSKTRGGGNYHLHISANLDDYSRTCLQEIASKHGLTYRENEGRILIYKALI